MLHALVVLEKYFVDVRMDRPEIALEIGNENRHGCLRDGEDAADNVADPIFLPQAKVTSDDPACIREQLDRQARYLYGHEDLPRQKIGCSDRAKASVSWAARSVPAWR